MTTRSARLRVGELRPSQILFSFGVGAIVDLPNISAMVMGLDDWDLTHATEVWEDRLLEAVRRKLGPQVQHLCLPPLPPDEDLGSPFFSEETARIGVPVAPFPRWMRCPSCNLLAPLDSGLFDLKTDRYRADRTRYVHANCNKKLGSPPTVLPARFLAACERGHLNDFPWLDYVHRQRGRCGRPVLRLMELGVSGEAKDVLVVCDNCGTKQVMARAFGEDGRQNMPGCGGSSPHLHVEREECPEQMTAILLGASNSWFPVTLSALSVPRAADQLGRLVEDNWAILKEASSPEVLKGFRSIGQLRAFAGYSDDEIWAAIEVRRARAGGGDEVAVKDLRRPEWEVFSQADPSCETADFRLRLDSPPSEFESFFSKVVLVERLREVQALVGFTRIESPGDLSDLDALPEERRAPLCRKQPCWVPASEVRGEGLFIEFNEEALAKWARDSYVLEREARFREATKRWRQARKIQPVDAGFPGARYVLLHTFAHALLRQLALECGYTTASIRERIFSRDAEVEGGPMAGVLLYTAAPDSEGTLGGLVSLGQPSVLGRHLDQAFEQARVCSSDPLCAEHLPVQGNVATLHGSACHACLFAPETSCERGNRFLDRALLVRTFGAKGGAFFDRAG